VRYRTWQDTRHAPAGAPARSHGGGHRRVPVATPADRLLHLQRTAGNRAVQGLLRETRVPGVRVSRPGDVREREADRIAETVLRTTGPPGGRTTRRAAVSSLGDGSPPVPELVPGTGRPLPDSARHFFEPRFGGDLGAVRVHTDVDADRSARSMDALAYTLGRDIVFRSGSYAPDTDAGRRLLAHELAHVVQQQPGPPTVLRTPAPPSHRGVTGKHDPSRVRIDPIAVFVPTVFVPSATVGVSITDPDVKHLTWELYDPKDQMYDGWSTLPGNPTSTSRPFTLKASRFTEENVAGTYLLRCTGLNARHEPIVYADHRFAVRQPVGTELSPLDYAHVDIDQLSRGRGTFDGGFGSEAFRRFVYEGREVTKTEAAGLMTGNMVRHGLPRSFYDPGKRWAVTASILSFDTGISIREEVWHKLSTNPRDRDMALAILQGSEAGFDGRFGRPFGGMGGPTGGRGSTGRGGTAKPPPGTGAAFEETSAHQAFRALGGVRQGYKVRVCDDSTVVETATSRSNVGLNARYQGGAFTDPSTKTVWIHESLVALNGITRSWGAKLNVRQVIAHELGHVQAGSFDCAAASRTGAGLPGLTAGERQGLLDDALRISKGGR
jgi:hypothetical protein